MEKRQSKRYSYVGFLIFQDGEFEVSNISPMGLAIKSRQNFERFKNKSKKVTLLLPEKDSFPVKIKITLGAKVRYSMPENNDAHSLYRTGFEFQNVSEKLQNFFYRLLEFVEEENIY